MYSLATTAIGSIIQHSSAAMPYIIWSMIGLQD